MKLGRYDLNRMIRNNHSITIKKESKQYYAYCEDLPGVYGLGDSVEETKRSILHAIRIYMQETKHCKLPPNFVR
jgi:predicted RNase H-like HicB family nuclease